MIKIHAGAMFVSILSAILFGASLVCAIYFDPRIFFLSVVSLGVCVTAFCSHEV